MVQVKVPAALAGGSPDATIVGEGETLRDLLQGQRHTDRFDLHDMVLEDDELRADVRIFIDGREIVSADTRLQPNSIVRVIPG